MCENITAILRKHEVVVHTPYGETLVHHPFLDMCADYIEQLEIDRAGLNRDVAILEDRLSNAQIRAEKLEGSLGLAEDEINRLREAIAESCDEARSDRMDCPRSARLENEVKRLLDKIDELDEWDDGQDKRIAELEARIASQVVTQERHMPLLQENLKLKAENKRLLGELEKLSRAEEISEYWLVETLRLRESQEEVE